MKLMIKRLCLHHYNVNTTLKQTRVLYIQTQSAGKRIDFPQLLSQTSLRTVTLGISVPQVWLFIELHVKN